MISGRVSGKAYVLIARNKPCFFVRNLATTGNEEGSLNMSKFNVC